MWRCYTDGLPLPLPLTSFAFTQLCPDIGPFDRNKSHHDWHCQRWKSCVCWSATLSQATCLRAVGEFVYVATTAGSLVVIDCNSLTVSAVCHPYTRSNPLVAAIIPLSTDDHSTPAAAELSRDQPRVKRRHSRLVTVGCGYVDLVGQTVARYTSGATTSSCDASHVMLVWSDSDWRWPRSCADRRWPWVVERSAVTPPTLSLL